MKRRKLTQLDILQALSHGPLSTEQTAEKIGRTWRLDDAAIYRPAKHRVWAMLNDAADGDLVVRKRKDFCGVLWALTDAGRAALAAAEEAAK